MEELVGEISKLRVVEKETSSKELWVSYQGLVGHSSPPLQSRQVVGCPRSNEV